MSLGLMPTTATNLWPQDLHMQRLEKEPVFLAHRVFWILVSDPHLGHFSNEPV